MIRLYWRYLLEYFQLWETCVVERKKWMSESVLLTFILHIHFRSVDLLTFWRCAFQCQCLRSIWRERHWSRLLGSLLVVVIVREVVVAIDEIFTSAAFQQMVKGIREWSFRFHKYRAPSQILIKELRSVLHGVVHMTLLTHLAVGLDKRDQKFISLAKREVVDFVRTEKLLRNNFVVFFVEIFYEPHYCVVGFLVTKSLDRGAQPIAPDHWAVFTR